MTCLECIMGATLDCLYGTLLKSTGCILAWPALTFKKKNCSYASEQRCSLIGIKRVIKILPVWNESLLWYKNTLQSEPQKVHPTFFKNNVIMSPLRDIWETQIFGWLPSVMDRRHVQGFFTFQPLYLIQRQTLMDGWSNYPIFLLKWPPSVFLFLFAPKTLKKSFLHFTPSWNQSWWWCHQPINVHFLVWWGLRIKVTDLNSCWNKVPMKTKWLHPKQVKSSHWNEEEALLSPVLWEGPSKLHTKYSKHNATSGNTAWHICIVIIIIFSLFFLLFTNPAILHT